MFSEFLSLETVLTFGGLVATVGVFTEIFKRMGFFLKVPVQLTSYVVALVTLILGNLALGTFSWGNFFLMILNAGVVSLSSNGGYDIVDTVANIGK